MMMATQVRFGDSGDMLLSSRWVSGLEINLSDSVRVWRRELLANLTSIPQTVWSETAQTWEKAPPRATPHPSWDSTFAVMDEIERWVSAVRRREGKWAAWARHINDRLHEVLADGSGLAGRDEGYAARNRVRMAFAWLSPITEEELQAIERSEALM